jgi:hypothetical protein
VEENRARENGHSEGSVRVLTSMEGPLWEVEQVDQAQRLTCWDWHTAVIKV